MKILSLADARFPIERANGVQTMATCHALAERGHDVRLVVRPDAARPARDPFAFYGLPKTPRLRIEAIGGAGGARGRRVAFLVSAIGAAAGSDADVVFTRDLGLAALLLRLPDGRRPPVVYESHGVAAVVAAEMPRLLGTTDAASPAKLARLESRERRVWRRAAAYVTITSALRDDLAGRYGGRDRVFVIPDGARPPAATHTRGDARTVGYAGHLYPWKGVDVFIRALALSPTLRGLIVGGHPGERDGARIDALVRELGLQDRVTITGLVPPAAVAPRLAHAGILVLPNTATAIAERYTSPLKLFEYLWMGRPIVASDLTSLREIVRHAESAWLVPAGDPTALAKGLDHVAGDPGLAARLGAAALALAPAYSWAARAEHLERAFAAARAS